MAAEIESNAVPDPRHSRMLLILYDDLPDTGAKGIGARRGRLKSRHDLGCLLKN
jgi:hypothetical protein